MAKAKTAEKPAFNLLEAVKRTSRMSIFEPTQFIETASPRLNWVLGGGIARGHITTIAGPAHSGKTTLALTVAKVIQDNASKMLNGGKTLYVCFEKSVPEWEGRIGLNSDSFIVYYPTHGEAAMNVVRDAIKNKAVDLIIWDTISNTTFRVKEEASFEDNTMLIGPRKWSDFLTSINAALDGSGVAFIGLNHIQQKVGEPGSYEPGGQKWETVPSVKLQMLKPDDDASKEDLTKRTGREFVWLRYQTYIKNRFAPVYRFGKTAMYVGVNRYEAAIEPWVDYVELGEMFGLLQKSGNWYHTPAGDKINGAAAMGEWLRAHPKEQQQLEQSIQSAILHTARMEKQQEDEELLPNDIITEEIELGDPEGLPEYFNNAGSGG